MTFIGAKDLHLLWWIAGGKANADSSPQKAGLRMTWAAGGTG